MLFPFQPGRTSRVPKCRICYNVPLQSIDLFFPQDSRSSSLRSRAPLLLVTLIKRDCACMVPADIVKVLDLVDADNPILARERLVERAELGPLLRKPGAADAVLGLARGEERVVIVVGHFVPRHEQLAIGIEMKRQVGSSHERIPHGRSRIVVDLVLAPRGKEVSLLDLIGPDALSNPNHPQELVDIVAAVTEEAAEDD